MQYEEKYQSSGIYCKVISYTGTSTSGDTRPKGKILLCPSMVLDQEENGQILNFFDKIINFFKSIYLKVIQ